MRVLITGSAGAVGTTLIKGMRDRHEIRGLDLVPTPDLDDALIGDVADYHTVEEAVYGMDALIHLANVRKYFHLKILSPVLVPIFIMC